MIGDEWQWMALLWNGTEASLENVCVNGGVWSGWIAEGLRPADGLLLTTFKAS